MILITGGCSFSADNFCWPVHLAESLRVKTHYQTGVGSSGNDFISRRVLDALLRLDNYDNVLVGVMWSAAGRKSFYTNSSKALEQHKPHTSATSPYRWGRQDHRWIFINPGFNDRFAENWYRIYHNETHQLIETYEHVLRLQWFLKANNIKYFFTTMNGSTFDQENIDYSHVSLLKEQVDWTHFLPITGCVEWNKQHLPKHFPVPGDDHPGDFQHSQFVEHAVIPWLKNKYDL